MRMIGLKRTFDVVGASLALLVASPVLMLAWVAVRFALGSPAIFRQVRPGLNERPFMMYKFRTMLDSTDADGNPLDDAVRLTRFGRWLRSTSLDELPELFNVLRGDMSFVGPRPLLMDYLPLYSQWQRRRHEVRPGITGWAQVNGRNALSWPEKFRLDVWYVDNWSILLDLRILLLTVIRVVGKGGITGAGQATAKKFTGEQN